MQLLRIPRNPVRGGTAMLSEQIYTGQGKRTARRVLGTQPFTVEVSFEDRGKLLGLEGANIGTYTSSPRPDGTLTGEGQGIFATVDGEVLTWKGIGTGRLKPGGALSYRGALTFSATSERLSRLNSIAGVFEFEVDEAGNISSQIWEWK
jgi:hypothetical protein